MSSTYRIVRFYANKLMRPETIDEGLTLEDAKAHCSDPETSSKTAKGADAVARTEKYGAWFDGFDQE